jgi:hypothetical protein
MKTSFGLLLSTFCITAFAQDVDVKYDSWLQDATQDLFLTDTKKDELVPAKDNVYTTTRNEKILEFKRTDVTSGYQEVVTQVKKDESSYISEFHGNEIGGDGAKIKSSQAHLYVTKVDKNNKFQAQTKCRYFNKYNMLQCYTITPELCKDVWDREKDIAKCNNLSDELGDIVEAQAKIGAELTSAIESPSYEGSQLDQIVKTISKKSGKSLKADFKPYKKRKMPAIITRLGNLCYDMVDAGVLEDPAEVPTPELDKTGKEKEVNSEN